MAQSEAMPLPEEDAEPDLAALLAMRGFRKLHWWEGVGYGPPFLQPGGIAPPGNTGDPEVRRRILEKRKQARYPTKS